MRRFLILLACLGFVAHSAAAGASERRFALVFGNGSYAVKTLPTSINDAALIAQTLQSSGFEVTSLRNVNEAILRQSFRDFLIKVKNAGPDTIVAVYFAGLGLQCEGENYLLPIDAVVSQPSDVLRHALPLSEQMHSLAALHVKASFLILDAARASPFLLSGQPPASGLAWVEAEANMLVAFNAAPGTVARDSIESYGAYAIALAEMMREGGLGPEDRFDRVRLRVNELTGGAQVPWDAANIQSRFDFSQRAQAPKRADPPERMAWMRSQPMRKLSPDDAYWIALLRDTFDGYAEFLAEYWNDPMAKRVEALLAARRESITWRRSNQANEPDAYWTYLDLYPHGPHAADAERLLVHLGAAVAPPPKFRRLDYDVPPPLPAEFEFADQSVLSLDDPAFAFAPLKPPPVYVLEAPPPELQALAQKFAHFGKQVLPRTLPSSSPTYVSIPPQTSEKPDQLAIGTVGPTNGGATSNAPGDEGQGGSLVLPGAGGGTKPVGSLPPSMSRIDDPRSPALPAVQSSPFEDTRAFPGQSLPAWASLLPKENNTLNAPSASNSVEEPLFVSSALAPVSSLVARKVWSTPVANARLGSQRAPLASAAAQLSGGSTQPPTTASIAAASPSSVTSPGAPNGGRARALPGPIHALTMGNNVPAGTRPVPQLATGVQGRASHAPSQPTQSTPHPDNRAARVVASPASNGPKPAPTPTVARTPATDQTAQYTVRKRKPEPPMQLAPDPEVSSAASAPQSDKNPCTVSDGRLNCDDAR